MCANNFLRQESFLKGLVGELSALPDTDSNFVQEKLDSLRQDLFKNNQIRFYMCSDLTMLGQSLAMKKTTIDAIWLEKFPANLSFNNQALFTTNCAFCVPPVWTLKKSYERDVKSKLI